MAKVVSPQDGKAGFLGSIGVRFMLGGDESGGGVALVEHPMSARALAAPLHKHALEDEYSFILSGRVGALLGEEVLEGGPGDPHLQAPQPVAHVLERRGRTGAHSRSNLPCRLREVLRRAGCDGRRHAGIAGADDGTHGAVSARNEPRQRARTP